MRVAIIGVGGTGCTAAQLLSRSGFDLLLIDRDIVEESNLDRQILYDKNDIGNAKVIAAEKRLGCKVETRFEDVNPFTIDLQGIDLVIDCTDNIQTRLLINDYCKKNRIPWIYTGAVAKIGALYFNHPEGPCFSCFNRENYGDTCNEVGVLTATVSLVGSMAASMALSFRDGTVDDNLIRMNLENNRIDRIKVKKNPDCSACQLDFKYLNSSKNITRFCSDTFQINSSRRFDLEEVEDRISAYGKVQRNDHVLRCRDFTVFPHGSALIKAKSEAEAKKKYDQVIGITL